MLPLGNVAVGRRRRLLPRHDPGSVREPVAYLRKNQPVVPSEAFSAAHRLQKKQGQEKALHQRATAGAEAYFTAAIATTVRRNQGRIGGVVHGTPRNDGRRRGELQIDLILHQHGGRAQFLLDTTLLEDGTRPDAKEANEKPYFRCRYTCTLGRYWVSQECSIFGGCCKVCMTTQYCSVFACRALSCSFVACGARTSKMIRIL